MLLYQRQTQSAAAAAAATSTISPPASTNHVRGQFCAEACESCTNAILEAMAAGYYGTAPARTRAASFSRLEVAARTATQAIAPFAMVTRSRARVLPVHSGRAPASTIHAQTTSRISKPAQRRARSARTQPPTTPRPEASTGEKVTIRLRWSPTLVIPDPRSSDQTIRSGGRKLQLEPKWRAQKVREWHENRSKFEHEQQRAAENDAAQE